MSKGNPDNIHQSHISDSSSLILNDESESQLDFSGLFSNRFTNIMPLYSSRQGATEIHTATRYGKRFILKGIKEQYRKDPVHALSLAKEFEIGISLEHPNIRRTLSLESVDGLGEVIVLEYIDGCSLDHLIASGKLTLTRGRQIIEQTVEAMAYLHGKQIFHRDLKPANIMVSYQDSIVKLIDFNLSDSSEFIVLKNPAGSLKYMAPEQQLPDAKPSAVADIYSLGVVMQEIATVTGDDDLASVANDCTHLKSEQRPQSLSRLHLPSSQPTIKQSFSKFLASKSLTYIMLSICIALAISIAYLSLQ